MAKRGRGQPTKLTPELIERLCEALSAGNYIETSCLHAGIGVSTYHAWVRKAEEPNAPKLYQDFLEAVKKARATAEVRNVALIQQAATKHWQAGAWWLERSFPDRWGRQSKVVQEISGPNGEPLEALDAKSLILDFINSRVTDLED